MLMELAGGAAPRAISVLPYTQRNADHLHFDSNPDTVLHTTISAPLIILLAAAAVAAAACMNCILTRTSMPLS